MNGHIETACLHCRDTKHLIFASNSDAAWLGEIEDIRQTYGKIISKESGSSIFFLQPCSSGMILIVANMIPNRYGDNLSAYLHLPFGIKVSGDELEVILCDVLVALQKNRKDAVSSCLARVAAKEYPVETIRSFKKGSSVSDFAYREVDAYHSFASILSCVFQPYYAAYKYVALVQKGQTIINRDKFDNLTTKGIRAYVREAEAERMKAAQSQDSGLDGSKQHKEGKKNGKEKSTSNGKTSSDENNIPPKEILSYVPSIIKTLCIIVIIAMTIFGIKSLSEHSYNEQTETVENVDTSRESSADSKKVVKDEGLNGRNTTRGNTEEQNSRISSNVGTHQSNGDAQQYTQPKKSTAHNNDGAPARSGVDGYTQPRRSTANNDDVEYVAQQASRRYLDYDDISGLSRSELRIVRNWIFARYGYAFKSPELQRYFRRKSWYTPMYSDVSSHLTRIERQNVMFIKQYE